MIADPFVQYKREAADMLEIPGNFKDLSKLYTRHFDVVRADTPALLDRVYELRYQVYCLENAFENPAANLGGLRLMLTMIGPPTCC